MRMGVWMPFCLTFWQISMPSISGRSLSRMRQSYSSPRAKSSPVWPSKAMSTAYDSCSSPFLSDVAILCSSSTTRILMGVL